MSAAAQAPVRPSGLAGRLRPVLPYLGLAALTLGLWAVLVSVNDFLAGVLASILIWTVATSGLNVIAGLGGYPSLVQGAFYGIGAYAATLALTAGWPLWLATLLAVALAGLAGLFIGLVFSRTRGQYFGIGTLFFGVVVALVLNNWTSLTHGPLGLPAPFGFATNGQLNAVIAASAGLALALVRALGGSRLGRRLATIRADEDLAEHIGVPTARTKLLAFVISAMVGGYAGVLIAQYNGTISPELFDQTVGFVMFVAVSVGGAGRLLGPLVGSAFIVGVPDLLTLPSGIGLLVVGAIFVVVVILVPDGLIGGGEALWRHLAGRRR